MQFDEFLSVIDLLKNPEKYAAQIAELQARNDAITESIKTLGVVGDVAKAKAAAQAQADKAASLVDKANREAESILAGARTAYDKKFADLQKKEVAADQALADHNTMKSTFAARSDELRKAEKALEQAQKQLDADRADLASKQAEVEVRLAKLREAMG